MHCSPLQAKHRFYIAPEQWEVSALTLRGAEAHHAHDVLRLNRGAHVVVFNGQGEEILAEVAAIECGKMELRELRRTQAPRLRSQIILVQAIPKGKNMELIVQKAVELGASEIAPLISEHTIVRLDESEAIQKQAKWRQVAIEAAKQSGQNWLPTIRRPEKIGDFFAKLGKLQPGGKTAASDWHRTRSLPQLRLIGSLQAEARHLKSVILDYEREHVRRPENVLICIGPEGDFTEAELNLARQHGCCPITLGPIILRVETAAITCLSVLAYELLA